MAKRKEFPGRGRKAHITTYDVNDAYARPVGKWSNDPKQFPADARRQRPKGARSHLLTRKAADALVKHAKAVVEYADWLSCYTRIYVQRIRMRRAYIEIVTLRESMQPIYAWDGPGDTYIIHRVANLHIGRAPKEERPSRAANEYAWAHYSPKAKPVPNEWNYSGRQGIGNEWRRDAP